MRNWVYLESIEELALVDEDGVVLAQLTMSDLISMNNFLLRYMAEKVGL